MTFFREKISIFMPKNSDDLFLVIDQVFIIFTLFFQILRIFTVLNVVYDPFFTRRATISEDHYFRKEFLDNTFFTLFVLLCPSDNTTFQNIGGRMHGPSPHLKFWGTVPPVLPMSPPLTARDMQSCG